MLVASIFSFSHDVFSQFWEGFVFNLDLFFSSANAFNLDQSKNLLFGKELNLYQTAKV